ncbi:hypothetical protein D3C59_16100 [Streptomyces sp. SHP22-7]|nr:hypothetical protein D3C59_16100 [Streptomyces sp. SHP22-7]
MKKGKPEKCHARAQRNGYSAAVRDPTGNPDRTAGEATQIRVGVHLPVASFQRLWVCLLRKLVAAVTPVKSSGTNCGTRSSGPADDGPDPPRVSPSQDT